MFIFCLHFWKSHNFSKIKIEIFEQNFGVMHIDFAIIDEFTILYVFSAICQNIEIKFKMIEIKSMT